MNRPVWEQVWAAVEQSWLQASTEGCRQCLVEPVDRKQDLQTDRPPELVWLEEEVARLVEVTIAVEAAEMRIVPTSPSLAQCSAEHRHLRRAWKGLAWDHP